MQSKTPSATKDDIMHMRDISHAKRGVMNKASDRRRRRRRKKKETKTSSVWMQREITANFSHSHSHKTIAKLYVCRLQTCYSLTESTSARQSTNYLGTHGTVAKNVDRSSEFRVMHIHWGQKVATILLCCLLFPWET